MKPKIFAAAAVAFVAVFAAGSNAADKPNQIVASDMKPRLMLQHEQKTKAQPFKRGLVKNSISLYSRKGQRLEARYTKKGYVLYNLSRGKHVRAADGTYRLQGGGRIKVEKGFITWADKLSQQRSNIAGIRASFP